MLAQLFQELSDPWPDACLLLSTEGKIIALNTAATKVLELDRKEATGRSLYDFAIDQADTISAYLMTCAGNRQQVPGALTLQNLAGQSTRYQCFGFRVRIDPKMPPAIFLRCASADSASNRFIALNRQLEEHRLTNRNLKATHARLQQAKERWEETFNAIDQIITIHDREMRILQANRTAGLLCGVPSEELIGRHCYEIFREAQEPCTGCPELLAIADLKPHRAIIQHEKLGKIFEVSSFPLLDEQGKLLNSVHVAKDITEQKRIETKLNQAQKMEAIGTLAGGIAHDFNNILTPIIGYAELSLATVDPSAPLAASINAIHGAAMRAKELVKQILTFSRQTEHEKKLIQPHLMVKEALKLLRASLPTTIEIRENIPTDCGMIMGDPSQLHQIVMNLCTNAFHAMREKGGILGVALKKVTLDEADRKVISLDLPPGNYLEIEVSDTGHGMEPKTVERIFEPYFTTKKLGEGTGLGLSVVHGIVKNYQGHISVYSEPGQGTTFHVYLPRVDATTDRGQGKARETIASGHERLLVVDDEPAIIDLLHTMLTQLGYKVTSCINSQEALQLLQENPGDFDLMITDMTMPALTGLDLTQKVFEIRPDLPVILCTGFSELINKEKATAIGIREFLMKPVSIRDLAHAIRKALGDNPATK